MTSFLCLASQNKVFLTFGKKQNKNFLNLINSFKLEKKRDLKNFLEILEFYINEDWSNNSFAL